MCQPCLWSFIREGETGRETHHQHTLLSGLPAWLGSVNNFYFQLHLDISKYIPIGHYWEPTVPAGKKQGGGGLPFSPFDGPVFDK